MRMRFPSTVVAALGALLGLLLLVGTAAAAPTTLTATLAGGEGLDPDGSGSATITLDPDTGQVCWDLSVENVGAVAASHIHVGGAGESGGVVVPLDVDGFDGTSEACATAEDSAVFADIIANPSGYYVNIHTAEFSAGAIRGQLSASSAPPNTATEQTDPPVLTLVGMALLALAVAGMRLDAARRRA
ncbi:MAG TPA: CHRD domain-containing protein [candidate division Zixibacteria bacterium]|nr:CHRD domain-containing protein [candidate division Zixibacteria bacterium]